MQTKVSGGLEKCAERIVGGSAAPMAEARRGAAARTEENSGKARGVRGVFESLMFADKLDLMQRGPATLKLGDRRLDALFGERIETLLEKLPVVGNRVLEFLALVAHAHSSFIGRRRAPSIIGICQGVDR